jgi:trans-aconitate 2-methyltransferase
MDNWEDLDADYYVEHSSLQNNLATEILNDCHLDPSTHILDVGCGDGKITAELASHVREGKVIGLDASPSMIDFASKNFPKTKFPNLDFQLGNVEQAEFSQKFDLIVSFSCFHWIKNPGKVISQLSSLLKPGGEILILTYPKESPYYQYLQIALKNYPEYCHLSANNTMLLANEYKKFLSKNQLEILDFQQRNLFATYNNCEEIHQFIKGWLNNYVPLPEHLYDPFLEDVTNAVINDPSTCKDQKITIPYTALVIKARKRLDH